MIPLLSSQNFRDFEIILVDDRSTDDTEQWISSLSIPQLRYIKINETETGWSSKKFALQQGIACAKHPIVLLTDADCRPVSKDWIGLMTTSIGASIQACIGYSPYNKENSFLNKLIRFETLHTAAQYLSLALAGMPYMGVGRNMAYTKKLFEDQHGFSAIKNILGGDDDLFANNAFTSRNVFVKIDSESFVYSIPKKTYKEWVVQKTRHLHAGIYYKSITRLILGLLMGSQILFYLTSFSAMFIESYMSLFIIGILFRTLVLIYIFVRLNINLKENFKWYWLPILDIIFTINYIYIGLIAYFFNTNKWK